MPRTPPRLLAVAALVVPQAAVLLVQPAAPFLLRQAPLLLLALHPFEPWSLLVSPQVRPVTFVVVVVTVRAVPCSGDYLLGLWYGERALAAVADRRGVGRAATGAVRLFTRARGPALLLYPGATVSVLAGATRMPARRFFPLLLAGLLLWALLTRFLATAAAGPVAAVVAFVDAYAVALAAVLLVVVVLPQLRGGRR